MRLADQAGGVEFLPGKVVDQMGEISIAFIQCFFDPTFQAVSNPLAVAVKNAAQAIPAATAHGMAKFPLRQGVAQGFDEGDGPLLTGTLVQVSTMAGASVLQYSVQARVSFIVDSSFSGVVFGEAG